jgi:hypothetical protein
MRSLLVAGQRNFIIQPASPILPYLDFIIRNNAGIEIGMYGSLFHSISITHSFQIEYPLIILFIHLIGVILLLLSVSFLLPDFLSYLLFDPSICFVLFPVYNADTDKLKILSENKGKSGIYKWTNKINGRAQKYILVLR